MVESVLVKTSHNRFPARTDHVWLITYKLLNPKLFSFQVVEAALWKLSLEYDVFAADATLAAIAKRGSSTRLLWSGQSFASVSKIFIPINEHGIHWTLLVLDKSQKIRLFLDPMNGQKHRIIDFKTNPDLMDLIDKIR